MSLWFGWHALRVCACQGKSVEGAASLEQNMRNFLMVMVVVLVGWTSNARAQSLTGDPESIVPLPDAFNLEIRHLMCRPRWPAFTEHGSGPGTTTGISLWSSG